MPQVVNLARYRRLKQGRRPVLGLLGLRSTTDTVLQTALAAADPEDRTALFERVALGSYADMIAVLVDSFEIVEVGQTWAVG